MPVYNASRYLREAIDSVLCQTFTDFEFLIFNDGSTDDSLEIIKSYNDERIVLIDSPVNQGYLVYLNEGVRMAKGKYIARMDSDDVCMPNRFELQFQFLENNFIILVVGSNFQVINSGGIFQLMSDFPTEHSDIQASMMFYCSLQHPAIMAVRDVMLNNPYDIRYYPSEDHRQWVTLSKNFKLANIAQPLIKYRMHGENISGNPNQKLLNAQMMLQHEYETRLKLNKNIKCLYTHRQLYFADYENVDSGYLYFSNNILTYLDHMNSRNNSEKIFDAKAFQKLLKVIWDKVYYYHFMQKKQYINPFLVFSELNEDKSIQVKIKWFVWAIMNDARVIIGRIAK